MNGIPANDTLPDPLAAAVPATAEQFAYMQWADCSILDTVGPAKSPCWWLEGRTAARQHFLQPGWPGSTSCCRCIDCVDPHVLRPCC